MVASSAFDAHEMLKQVLELSIEALPRDQSASSYSISMCVTDGDIAREVKPSFVAMGMLEEENAMVNHVRSGRYVLAMPEACSARWG